MGDTLALLRASLTVFCLILRLTWGFIMMLYILGSLIIAWVTKKTTGEDYLEKTTDCVHKEGGSDKTKVGLY